MSKRIFTEEQMRELLNNKNVAKCSKKSITYSKEFKITAVKSYFADGLTASEIFKNAGFDLRMIGRKTPKSQLRSWRRVYKNKGINELNIETRGRSGGGGRLKTKEPTDADKIKRMEVEIAYLKAENDFLAKLRAAKKR